MGSEKRTQMEVGQAWTCLNAAGQAVCLSSSAGSPNYILSLLPSVISWAFCWCVFMAFPNRHAYMGKLSVTVWRAVSHNMLSILKQQYALLFSTSNL